MIFVIDDDITMAGCVAKACKKETEIFTNAIEAMQKIADGTKPKLIFLDILLDGPDGFTFLNEMVSYSDTMEIPVVIVTSLNLLGKELAEYGVVGVLDKEKMTPKEIYSYVEKYC